MYISKDRGKLQQMKRPWAREFQSADVGMTRVMMRFARGRI